MFLHLFRRVPPRKLWNESSVGRTFGNSSVGRTFGNSSVERTFGDNSVGRTFETVLSEEFSSSSPSSSALAAEHADIRQELDLDVMMMTMTIVSAQSPTLCGRPPCHQYSTRNRMVTAVTRCSTLEPSSSLMATSNLFGSSMTSTEMNNDKTIEGNQVKAQIEEDKKTTDSQSKEPDAAMEADFGEDDGAKDGDDKEVSDANLANPKDVTTDGNPKDVTTDGNSKDIIDDGKKASDAGSSKKASDAKSKHDIDDGNKTADGDKSVEDNQGDWSNWRGSWAQHKGSDRGLSQGGKKKLNKQMRELVRAVHVGALSYVLPDKSKKCCMTWRAAIDLHLDTTGRRPNWSSHFIQCKLCGKFHTSEREFETHYSKQHVDMGIYKQTLRRLKQWDTSGVPVTEVEWNINLIYSIGESLDLQEDSIEKDILEASGIDAAQFQQQQQRQPSSSNRPRDPALSRTASSLPTAASTMAPETPTTPTNLTPRLSALVEKGRAKMGSLPKPDDKVGSKAAQHVTKDHKRSKKDDDDAKRKKATVVNVDPEEDSSAYEYYSESTEPPNKKSKSSGSKKPEEMDVEGWKKRATEVEKLLP